MPAHRDQKRKTWYFKTYYTDVDGKRKQKMLRGFKGRKEAREAERHFLNEIERVKGGDLTLQEVFDHRLEHTKLEEGTIYTQKMFFKNHILKHFENKLISEITVHDLNEFKKYLTSTEMSSTTQSGIYNALITLFRHASTHFKLNDDTSDRVKGIKIEKTDISPIDIDVFKKEVSKIERSVDQVLCQLLFYTGLRVGEALALTWRDIDFDKSNIQIFKTYDLNRRKIKLKTKTNKSTATVPFPDTLKDVLLKWYEDMKRDQKYFNEDYYLFEALAPIKYTTFRYQFKKIFPNHRIHDLRHSYASYLASNGVELIVLKELMRHESIKTTADTYSHVYDDKKRKAIEFFNE